LKYRIALLLFVITSIACGSSVPRKPLELYPTPNALPTQTERVIVWTQTPNALPTAIIMVITATPNATRTPNTSTVTALQALNVRGGRDAEARILVTLPTGLIVEVMGECTDGWALITFPKTNGIDTGWVNADFLSGSICP